MAIASCMRTPKYLWRGRVRGTLQCTIRHLNSLLSFNSKQVHTKLFTVAEAEDVYDCMVLLKSKLTVTTTGTPHPGSLSSKRTLAEVFADLEKEKQAVAGEHADL